MDADGLVRAIRAALDGLEQVAPDIHERDCAVLMYEFDTDCHCDRPAAVLRRVAADLRVLERHLPELGIQRAYYCRRCHVPVGDPQWPCDEIRDLCDRLGINPETETP